MTQTDRRPSAGVYHRLARFMHESASLPVIAQNLEYRDYRAARAELEALKRSSKAMARNQEAFLNGL